MARHYRVTIEDALEAHRVALRVGGRSGIRDIGLIESAISRPYHGYHRSIAQKAAALLQAVAQNHGFQDGNKRTAILLTVFMVSRSGYVIEHVAEDPSDAMEELVLDVVEKRLEFEAIVTWFRARLRRSAVI